MEQYINKSALVAEIDSWRDGIKKGIFSIPLTGSDRAYATFEYEILGKVKDLLDTLEVKEVQEGNLENEFFNWYNEEKNRDYNASILYERYSTISKKLAKHFFELGKAQKGE